MVFQVVMYRYWELDHEEGWVLKNWCFWTEVLEILKSPLDCKQIKPVNPKGNQSWIFTGGTDAEAEAPILWPPDVKSWFIWKDPDSWKDWRQEEKGMTEDEMVRWHHWINGHKFEQTPGDGEDQWSLVCCSPRGRKESDMTEHLNNNVVCGILVPQPGREPEPAALEAQSPNLDPREDPGKVSVYKKKSWRILRPMWGKLRWIDNRS